MVVENRTCIVCPRNWTPFMTSAFVACAVCANWMSALEWSLLLTVRRNNERHMIFTRSTSPKVTLSKVFLRFSSLIKRASLSLRSSSARLL